MMTAESMLSKRPLVKIIAASFFLLKKISLEIKIEFQVEYFETDCFGTVENTILVSVAAVVA